MGLKSFHSNAARWRKEGQMFHTDRLDAEERERLKTHWGATVTLAESIRDHFTGQT